MTILVVQRGHVPRTRGATGAPGEQAMAIRNAAEILEIAKDLPDVTPRIIDADEPDARYAGDRFIALHGDGSANTGRQEASVGHRNDEGQALGARWKQLYEAGGWPFGFLPDNYTVNLGRYYGTGRAVSANNPQAIIVEHGFMTNAKSRAYIESDQGVRLAAAAAICACYPTYDLAQLLGAAPKPPKVKDPKPPPSTRPSETIITVGDRGSDVTAWQRQLVALLPKDPDAHKADGIFGPKTARWTVRALRSLGLTVRDTSRPLVGPKSRAAMDKALADSGRGKAAPSWHGRKVRAKTDLRFYDSPRWTNPVGTMKKGHHFPHIEARLPVGGGHQYRVRNSRRQGPYYVTAATKYVDLV